MIVEKAHAKINLYLEVGNKREDGFHEVKNLMVPLELHDTLSFTKIEKGIEIIDSADIKKEDNFCFKAATLFFKTTNINSGVKIKIKKRIPISAGLAGGSSDASAVLRGLNRLFKTNLSLDFLAKISATLGSDMPYCVYQKPALCSGRGEKVELLRNISFNKKIVLLKPSFGLSTKRIYEGYVREENQNNNNLDNLILALKDNNLIKLKYNIKNDLYKSALSSSNELSSIVKELKNYFRNIYMSGSGPTLFVFENSKDKKYKKLLKNSNIFVIKTKIIS